jgi:anti-anti-sigma factor
MIVTGDSSLLRVLPAGSLVCWVVDDPSAYTDSAVQVLRDGRSAGDKTVAFGPEDSEALVVLRADAMMTADPLVAFLDGGPLVPDTMFTMLREQSARARAEGFEGLRIVADMDWLLPVHPTSGEIAAFELLLDRIVKELQATVVCAYRRSSFDTAAITGALSVHPTDLGIVEAPQFRLIAGDNGTWYLSGEVDLAVASTFVAAFTAAVSPPSVVDVSDLEFIDVAGMRTIAQACKRPNANLVLRGASAGLRRAWELAEFHQDAPDVSLVA